MNIERVGKMENVDRAESRDSAENVVTETARDATMNF